MWYSFSSIKRRDGIHGKLDDLQGKSHLLITGYGPIPLQLYKHSKPQRNNLSLTRNSHAYTYRSWQLIITMFVSNNMEVFLRVNGLLEHALGTTAVPIKVGKKTKHQREKNIFLEYILISIYQTCKFAVMKRSDPKTVLHTLNIIYRNVSDSLID